MGLSATLKEIGMSKARLGRVLDRAPAVVTRWGEDPPRYVWAYLELALELKRIRDAAQGALDQGAE